MSGHSDGSSFPRLPIEGAESVTRAASAQVSRTWTNGSARNLARLIEGTPMECLGLHA